MQAQPFQRAFNRLYYLKSHPNAQKQFGRIAAIKYSFQYSLVGTNGLSFITTFSCDGFCPLVRHGICHPPPHVKEHPVCCRRTQIQLISNEVRLNPNLQPHPIYGAILWVLFEFSHSISGNAFIVSRRCTNHHTTNIQSFKRSMT